MEEILYKVSELEEFSSKREDLNNKQKEIKGKQEELKKLQEKRAMNISPITGPVLDEQIQNLESEIEGLNETYRQENQKTREEFDNKKEELRKLVERQKSLYKRRDSLEQERAKGLEEVKKGREEVEKEFAQRNGKIVEEVAQAWSKRKIYEQILEDAKVTRENMIKAFSEGKTVGQTDMKSVLDEISANEKKIEDIDSNISRMKQDFENDKQAKMTELDDYEDRVNHYTAVEDNMEEIDDLEHLEMSLNSFTFDNLDMLKNSPVIASLRQREQKVTSLQQQEETTYAMDSKTSDDAQSTEEEKTETKEDYTQYDLDAKKALDSLDQTDIGIDLGENQNVDEAEQGKSEDDDYSIKVIAKNNLRGITIKDGILISLEKDGEVSEVKVDLKHVRKAYKMTEDEKLETLRELIGDDRYFIDYEIDSIIRKADPNVILGLKSAANYVAIDEVGVTAKTYLEALRGNEASKKEMKEFVTYDMRRSGLSSLNFVKRIRNYRYFTQMKKYIGNARDLVTVIEDSRSKGLKGLLERKKVGLLDKGKEKSESIAQTIKEKADDVKDALDDTAARRDNFVAAIKQGTESFRRTYSEGKTKLDNEGVPQIQTGPDLRTPKEKEEDEAIKNDDDAR